MMTGVTGPLAGRVAIVTGASRGIGRATALALGARGVRLLVHFRSGATEAAEVVRSLESLGTAAICVGGDLADRDVPASLVEAALRAFGRLDIVVNNGGGMTDALLEELDDATWEEAVAVHLSSAFRLVRAAAPAMRRVGWGRIVSVSSQVAATGSSGHAHYAAAKSGLNGLTYSLAKELGPDGITVNLVVPGTDLDRHHHPPARGARGRLAVSDAATTVWPARGSGCRDRIPRIGRSGLHNGRLAARQRRPSDELGSGPLDAGSVATPPGRSGKIGWVRPRA